jgi:predicted ester cyclase
MSTEENKAIVRRIVEEVWNNGNLNAVDSFYDFVGEGLHDPSDPWLVPGPAGESIKQLVSTYRTAFPDLHFTIEDQIAEERPGTLVGLERMVGSPTVVATRWTASGTQKGEFLGVPPTEKQVMWTGITIDFLIPTRIGMKLSKEWITYDALGLQQQLVGQLPSAAAM